MSRVRALTLAQGDSLRTIALRELGDASRWAELARLNDLRIPFILPTHRPAERLPHTLIWGDTLLVPWSNRVQQSPTPVSRFGADLGLRAGDLVATPGGDLALVAGRDNIVQALAHRVRTPRGELNYHPRYGCHVHLAVGLPANGFASLMASAWVHEALQEEPRLAAVNGVRATVAGDAIQVAASVEMVNANSPVDLNLVFNP